MRSVSLSVFFSFLFSASIAACGFGIEQPPILKGEPEVTDTTTADASSDEAVSEIAESDSVATETAEDASSSCGWRTLVVADGWILSGIVGAPGRYGWPVGEWNLLGSKVMWNSCVESMTLGVQQDTDGDGTGDGAFSPGMNSVNSRGEWCPEPGSSAIPDVLCDDGNLDAGLGGDCHAWQGATPDEVGCEWKCYDGYLNYFCAVQAQ